MTNLIPILKLSENWGINLNIFETNIINLAGDHKVVFLSNLYFLKYLI